jgi:hypothetical protein
METNHIPEWIGNSKINYVDLARNLYRGSLADRTLLSALMSDDSFEQYLETHAGMAKKAPCIDETVGKYEYGYCLYIYKLQEK